MMTLLPDIAANKRVGKLKGKISFNIFSTWDKYVVAVKLPVP